MCPAASSRWCPTPEQLMILEEMYRSGTRTPNASQIQNITAHLSFYGKIEGKNVFYWFQNHKARDRQKLRKKLMISKQLQQHQLYHQPQLINQKNNCHLLLDSPANSNVQQLTYKNSTSFLAQGGSGLEDASTVPLKMKYTWKVEIPERVVEMEKKSTMRMYNNKPDWMMMMRVDVGPPSQCCSRPLKTLELFPITATNLRDETNPSKHISCYTMSTT